MADINPKHPPRPNNKEYLESHPRIVTNSERSEFACQRRWWLRYHQGLSTYDSPTPLRMGSLWHLCMAMLYRSMLSGPRVGGPATPEQIGRAVIDPWLEQRLYYTQRSRSPNAEKTEAEDRASAIMTRDMLARYVKQFAAQDADWEVVAVESQVARWFVNPLTGKPIRDRLSIRDRRVFRRWAYGGAVDLIVRLKDGTYWLVEHKTTDQIDLDNYVRKLDWDPQIRGYAWAAADPIPFDGCLKEPIRITGVIYNVARKAIPRVPPVLKGHGKTGNKGELSRAAIDTTRDVYKAEIERLGFNPDAYADILEQLKQRTFFHREPYFFTDPELDDFGRDAAHHALQIKAASVAEYHPRQTRLCVGAVGVSPCPYRQPCIEDGPMVRKSFSVMGIRHAELTGVIAEPYVALIRPVTAPETLPEKTRLEEQLEASIDAVGQRQQQTKSDRLRIVGDDGTEDPFADDPDFFGE